MVAKFPKELLFLDEKLQKIIKQKIYFIEIILVDKRLKQPRG